MHSFAPNYNPAILQQYEKVQLLKAWSGLDLRKALTWAAHLGKYPLGTPNRIDLREFSPTLNRINELTTREGVEFGRGILIDTHRIDHLDPKIILSITSRGTKESILISFEPAPTAKIVRPYAAMIIHSHPPHHRWGLHLSDVDYVEFLVRPELVATCVSFRGRTLLAVKTSSTRKNVARDALGRSIQVLFRENNPNKSMEGAIAFTKGVCLEHGLSLFVSTNGSHILDKAPVA
jgi:hypothetical protein